MANYFDQFNVFMTTKSGKEVLIVPSSKVFEVRSHINEFDPMAIAGIIDSSVLDDEQIRFPHIQVYINPASSLRPFFMYYSDAKYQYDDYHLIEPDVNEIITKLSGILAKNSEKFEKLVEENLAATISSIPDGKVELKLTATPNHIDWSHYNYNRRTSKILADKYGIVFIGCVDYTGVMCGNAINVGDPAIARKVVDFVIQEIELAR